MATALQEERVDVSDVLADLGTDAPFQPGAPPRRRRWGAWLGIFGLLAVALVVGLATRWKSSFGAQSVGPVQTHAVKWGELIVTITEDGNLESADNLDIKCEVAGGTTILWIVEDGKQVEQGAELVRLDSAQLTEQINQQRITYEKARSSHIQAEKDFTTAQIAVQEYLEGTYRQQLQDLSAKITIAMENLRSAENSLQHTERMFRKGYVSPLQQETQQFAVERAKLDLESAKTAKDVLERFTKAKTVTSLEAQRDTAEAKKNSEKAAFDLEEARLKRLERYLKKCTLSAPKAGMVVYANDQGRGRFGPQQATEIKEGAQVREQQTILRLPDLTKMQVRVTVHESKVERVRPGMRARIRIQDREFQGSVFSVANQPEPSSFFSAAVKEYATIVRIGGESTNLKPGMTAEVEILVANLPDVLSVPVAAVFEHAGQTWCCVRKGKTIERQPVVLGMTNETFVEVKEGLQEGDLVVLNPRSFVPELREETRQQGKVDVDKRFGAGGPAGKPMPSPNGLPPGGRMPPGGEPAGRYQPGERQPGVGPEGPGSGPSTGNSPGERPGRPPGGPDGKRPDLMSFDKDGDGKISRAEAPDFMQSFFDKVDTNGDGFLDRSELNAMRSRARAGGSPPSGGPPGGGQP
jgi:multidrug resistance efflux pump